VKINDSNVKELLYAGKKYALKGNSLEFRKQFGLLLFIKKKEFLQCNRLLFKLTFSLKLKKISVNNQIDKVWQV